MIESIMQEKMYQLTMDLEVTAVEFGMKMRILDAIRELKQKLKKTLSKQQLQKEMIELDELVAEIKRQMVPESKEIAVNDVTTVSEDEIRQQIQNMLDESCRRNKVIAQESLTSEGGIQNIERVMLDFANAEANYDVITDSQRFMKKFEKIGKDYNQQMSEMTDHYVEEASANYDKTVKKIGGMLSGIKDERIKFGQRELYHQWSERYEEIKKQLKKEIYELDKGGSEIILFAETHVNKIAKIVKAEQRKCRWKKCMPLAVVGLIMFVILLTVIGVEVKEVNNAGGAIATEIGEAGLSETLKNADKYLTSIVESILKKLEDSSIFLLPVIVIPGVLYFKFIKSQNKKCKAIICQKTGKYLEETLKAFLHEKQLGRQLEKSYELIVGQVTDTYESVLKEIFDVVLYDERKDEQSSRGKMLKLCREWEQMKRGAI